MRPLRPHKSSALALSAFALSGMLVCAEPSSAQERGPRYPGMDESVNKTLAEEAGVPARDPYIDVESLGELWNLMLLGAGGLCGFIIGRRWDHMFGRRNKEPSST